MVSIEKLLKELRVDDPIEEVRDVYIRKEIFLPRFFLFPISIFFSFPIAVVNLVNTKRTYVIDKRKATALQRIVLTPLFIIFLLTFQSLFDIFSVNFLLYLIFVAALGPPFSAWLVLRTGRNIYILPKEYITNKSISNNILTIKGKFPLFTPWTLSAPSGTNKQITGYLDSRGFLKGSFTAIHFMPTNFWFSFALLDKDKTQSINIKNLIIVFSIFFFAIIIVLWVFKYILFYIKNNPSGYIFPMQIYQIINSYYFKILVPVLIFLAIVIFFTKAKFFNLGRFLKLIIYSIIFSVILFGLFILIVSILLKS